MSNNIGWFVSSDPSSDLVQITRFVTERIFATEENGYGTALRLRGRDPECLSPEKLAPFSASVLQAQRAIGENISLFQIWIKRRTEGVQKSRFAEDSEYESVRETERARNEFLSHRTLYEVSLYWVLYAHPAKLKVKNSETVLQQSQRMLRALQMAASGVMAELADFEAGYLDQMETLSLCAYMANLDRHAPPTRPRSKNGLARQICHSRLDWHRYGLVLNKGTTKQRFIQPFCLLKRPRWTAPAMLSGLLAAPGEIVVVLESRRRSIDEVRKAVGLHEQFMGFFRHNPLVLFFHRKKELPKTAASVAADANLEMTGLGGVLYDVSQRGLTYCTFSLLGLVHAESENELRDNMAALHRVFGASEARLYEEGIGALATYQSLFPGAVTRKGFLKRLVESLNVRRDWLREDHLANLSLCFSPEQGSARSDTLEEESAVTVETRAATPYYWDQFASGPRGMIVTGEPRRGKTFLIAFLVDHEAKYGGYVFIYDKGGAYENVVLNHGGTVVKVGLHGPRFGPFSLPDTEENRNHTAQLIMLLLKKGGAQLRPQDETDIRESVAAIYDLEDRRLRRLRYLVLSPDLQPYLEKWVGRGVYGAVFDNAEDDICLSRMISFDFEGLTNEDSAVLMEPLLFWIRLRVNSLIRAEGNLDVPKLEVYDEVHRLIHDPSVLQAIFDTMKTAGKKLGGIILATQDTRDLGPHAGIIRNACPDAAFLGGAFDREQYEKLYEMNSTEMDIIPTLRRGEFLFQRRHHSKVLVLKVDQKSTWTYSTHPQDVRRRIQAIQEHGRDKAFEVLAMSAEAK